jgi:hypothetical protein
VENISPYLIEAPNTVIYSSESPIAGAPKMSSGNQALDGGHFQITDEEFSTLSSVELEGLRPFLKKYVGAKELMAGTFRRILWLPSGQTALWSKNSKIMEHLERVRTFRLSRPRAETRDLALSPSSWGFTTNQGETFIAFPRVSSEAREYVPISFLGEEYIASDATLIVPNGSMVHFAVLTSAMHNSWIRIVAGRLKSDIRCSASITHNPFPWPEELDSNSGELEVAAQKILESRKKLKEPLGKMYTNLQDFTELAHAHLECDKVVDDAYGYSGNGSDEDRFKFLLALYETKLRAI